MTSGYISKDASSNNLTDLVFEFCENQLNYLTLKSKFLFKLAANIQWVQ